MLSPVDTWDVIFIKTDIPAGDEPSTPLSSENLTLGQDVYFLGFPYYKLIGSSCETKNYGSPMPYIKKAALSGVKPPVFFLSGYSNPGCSGGPLIFWDALENKYKIGGIMGGYIMNEQSITLKNSNQEIPKGLYCYENSGIAIAYDVSIINEKLMRFSNN